MKISKKVVLATVLAVSMPVIGYAAQNANKAIDKAREVTIRHYVMNLQNANMFEMRSLFDVTGFVYSTSEGKKNARKFFDRILPFLLTHQAKVSLHSVYKNGYLPNTFTGAFTLTWKNDDGSIGGGSFNDVFKFKKSRVRLHEVDMFESLAR